MHVDLVALVIPARYLYWVGSESPPPTNRKQNKMTAIALDILAAAKTANVSPEFIRDNGLAGDKRLALFDVDGVHVVQTNGDSVWEESDGYALAVAQLDGHWMVESRVIAEGYSREIGWEDACNGVTYATKAEAAEAMAEVASIAPSCEHRIVQL